VSAEWITIECERAFYAHRGKTVVLCDRLPSPITLVVKVAKPASQGPTDNERD
jgi:hypothetical protein